MGDRSALLGVRVELPREVPLSQGPPVFTWSRPSAGVRVVAYGEVARRVPEPGESGPGPLVARLTRPGQLTLIDGLGDTLPRPPGPWLGGAAFDGAQPPGRSWTGFGTGRFVAPAWLSWREAPEASEGGRWFAAAFAADRGLPHAQVRAELEARLEAVVARLSLPDVPLPAQPPLEPLRQPSEARVAWDALVGAALGQIETGALHKVVVARAIEVRAAGLLDPRPALLALSLRHPTCRIFSLRGDDGSWFLGATPELLCQVDGSALATEALAGTVRAADAAALLHSAKDLREHRWVVDHLLAGLSQLADGVAAPPAPRLRALADVAHLVTPLSARLRAGIGPGQVVAALHPTPAVAGVPRAAALRFLAANEGLRRGLYAGVVGLLGEGTAELAVALRSALLRGERARLFVGAGIVQGSSAEAEWHETELKAAAMLSALGAEGRERRAPRALPLPAPGGAA